MAKQFFKFTDGERTYFRASDTRVYLSGSVGKHGSIGFSGSPARLGSFPAVEIDRAEYDRLVALKNARWAGLTSPQDSWVLNSAIG